MNALNKPNRFPPPGIKRNLRSFSSGCLAMVFAACLILGTVGRALPAQPADDRPVGIVDQRPVSQENWVKPWKAEWDSGKVAELFRSHGVAAAVIGLEALKKLDRLETFRAILIPTDECYPDETRCMPKIICPKSFAGWLPFQYLNNV